MFCVLCVSARIRIRPCRRVEEGFNAKNTHRDMGLYVCLRLSVSVVLCLRVFVSRCLCVPVFPCLDIVVYPFRAPAARSRQP